MATKKNLVSNSNNNNNTYFSQKISKKTIRKPLCNTMNNIYSMIDKPPLATDVIGRVFGKKAQKEFQKVNIANRLKGFKRKGNEKVGGKQSRRNQRKTRKNRK